MIAPTEKTLGLLCLCLIVPSLLYAFATQLWNLPLKNGRGFFLGVQVSPGFYDGPDCRWLSRYRVMLATVHLVDFAALAAILALGRWDWTPIWAGCTAVFLTGSMMSFSFWARHRVGLNPPVLQAALALEPRRLGDYIWWPLEVFCFAVVACSWWMFLHSPGPVALQGPLVITWAVLGLLPGKVMLVRQGSPLPAERAEDHFRAQDAARRHSIRIMDAFGWLLTSMLFIGALRYAWPMARSAATAQWLSVIVPLAFGVLLAAVIARQGHVLAMSRTLRPAGSWTPPFGHATVMSRAGLTWFAIWFGGVMLLMLLVRG